MVEYTGHATQDILKKEGTEFQTTVPYNPEQNGLAKRKNHTICESARIMSFEAYLPTKYWRSYCIDVLYSKLSTNKGND